MPVWHEATRKWVKDGRLVLLGVTEEQHADRCRLFAQWKGFDWPILHDPINVLESTAVPILVALDEQGIVRSVRPDLATFEHDFLDHTFGDETPDRPPTAPGRPNLSELKRRADAEGTAVAWRRLGDALALWGGMGRLDEAVTAYQQTLRHEPRDANARFRLGVCYRLRSEGPNRRKGDFQAAMRAWDRALAADPNRYIWRRRIQQYGPRLDKPYPFYDWVEQAAAEVAARGEKPVPLAIQPSGAELAAPTHEFTGEPAETRSPDPTGRIVRDREKWIRVEVTVVPSRIQPGQTARIHVCFHPHAPNTRSKVHWNNESEPLRLWIDPPPGWEISQRLLTAPPGDRPETNEVRRMDFEVQVPADAAGTVRLPAYALYYVCEDLGGACRFLRQDLSIKVEIGR